MIYGENMEKHLLNGKWTLFISEEGEFNADYNSFTTFEQLEKTPFLKIQGSVPGNFELDMHAEGIIPDLFYGTNALKAQNLEYKHLWYCRCFESNNNPDKNAFLVFDGIDTFADIYLNGKLLGSADNMLIPHEFNVTDKLRAKNEVVVHIKPTAFEAQRYPIEAGCTVFQKYNAASLSIRKAAHMFGWDIMPRILSGGLWRDVYLEYKPKLRIKDVYAYTLKADSENAYICFYYKLSQINRINEYKIRITGACGDSRFEIADKLWHNEDKIRYMLENPLLWWPKNMGAPNLYEIRVELLHGDSVIDYYEFKFGIRTVKLERTDVTDENGSGEFKFYINNEPMFVMGTNWVPLDAFHSRDVKRLPEALKLLDEIGCNMVRCWGGNVYENDQFFDFCDTHGIAVWQDFGMGCATYPQTDDLCNKLKTEAEVIVKKLRRHSSLILWAGDNECDEAWVPFGRNPDDNILTRKILPWVINRNDPFRPYLPSSPYIKGSVFEAGKTDLIPEKHLWGPRDFFKGDYYKKSIAHFASETGYHGCPSLLSIKKFISPEKLWPPENNDEWLAHASCMELCDGANYSYRIPLMIKQVRNLWGEVPDNIEEFVLASQISQAEAMKYFVERFRYGKWRRTGIIWWNLLDGWPQFSDAVVDYYFNKKLAFNYIKRSQEPVCLMFKEPENGWLCLVAANEYRNTVDISYRVTDITENREIISGNTMVKGFSSEIIEKIKFDQCNSHFYFIEWTVNGVNLKNHYLSGNPPFNVGEYVRCAKKCGLV